jgi:hypothetical protein
VLALLFAVMVGLGPDQAAAADVIGGLTIGPFDRTRIDRSVTECDRLAAYEADEERVAPPVPRAAMDVDAAIAVCTADVAQQPENPRLHYQLSRLHGYRGDIAAARQHRARALARGYPVALFVAAHDLTFRKEAPDPCAGAILFRRAAQAGNFAARVGYPAYWLAGAFSACSPPAWSEVAADLNAARRQARTHYEELLVESLAREVARQTAAQATP